MSQISLETKSMSAAYEREETPQEQRMEIVQQALNKPLSEGQVGKQPKHSSPYCELTQALDKPSNNKIRNDLFGVLSGYKKEQLDVLQKSLNRQYTCRGIMESKKDLGQDFVKQGKNYYFE